MAEALTTVNDLFCRLENVTDSTRVFTDPDFLKRYSSDTSLSPARMPDVVVKALSTDEVQQIVKLANEHRVPVTPRSSGTGFYGAGIPQQGGIVVDLSDMNTVRRIDKRNRWAMFEAGVTYGQLQDELEREGMRAVNPLFPHREKSVVTSILEREPRLTPKHHLDETIFTMEMVLPTGDIFHTGSMSVSPGRPESVPDDAHCDLCNFHGPGIDWYRLVPGSLGTYGIVTVMNAKIVHIPVMQKIFFIGFDSLDRAVEPVYRILRKLIGDECFLLNGKALASLIAPAAKDIESLTAKLPAYVLVLNVTAGEWYPEDKMAYQENALREIARTYYVQPVEQLPFAPEAGSLLAGALYRPWQKTPYWRSGGRGASADVFFLTQLQRAPEFLQVITETASNAGYPLHDMMLYVQPKQNGRAFHMEACFPYDPDNPAEASFAARVHRQVSEELVARGAFFYRVYGEWADLVYPRTAALHETLKRIKRNLDPQGILNPGKLGF